MNVGHDSFAAPSNISSSDFYPSLRKLQVGKSAIIER